MFKVRRNVLAFVVVHSNRSYFAMLIPHSSPEVISLTLDSPHTDSSFTTIFILHPLHTTDMRSLHMHIQVQINIIQYG